MKLCRLRIGKAQLWASTPSYRLEGPRGPFAGAYLRSTAALGDPASGSSVTCLGPRVPARSPSVGCTPSIGSLGAEGMKLRSVNIRSGSVG